MCLQRQWVPSHENKIPARYPHSFVWYLLCRRYRGAIIIFSFCLTGLGWAFPQSLCLLIITIAFCRHRSFTTGYQTAISAFARHSVQYLFGMSSCLVKMLRSFSSFAHNDQRCENVALISQGCKSRVLDAGSVPACRFGLIPQLLSDMFSMSFSGNCVSRWE